MIAKLASASALVAAIASPALAGDLLIGSQTPQVYVERHERVYAPGEIVPGTAPTIATAPLAPRRYIYPTDSYAHYDGPYVTTNEGPTITYNDGYVAPRYVRPVTRGTYWNDPAGPACEPGTVVRAWDGRSYLCQ
jgi:hypothetical protein